jgi:hypothetical protein
MSWSPGKNLEPRQPLKLHCHEDTGAWSSAFRRFRFGPVFSNLPPGPRKRGTPNEPPGSKRGSVTRSGIVGRRLTAAHRAVPGKTAVGAIYLQNDSPKRSEAVRGDLFGRPFGRFETEPLEPCRFQVVVARGRRLTFAHELVLFALRPATRSSL